MYYLCSENKGADQLRGHREADLRLCFLICIKPVFSGRGSFCPAVQEKTDKIIAQELQEKEKMISAEKEKKEFQQLQVNMISGVDEEPI